MSLMFSNPKVEKVVKPPQKPVVNRRMVAVELLFLLKYEDNNPMRKHPKILMRKVGRGKVVFVFSWMMKEQRYLHALPMPPPKKTKTTDNQFIIERSTFSFEWPCCR